MPSATGETDLGRNGGDAHDCQSTHSYPWDPAISSTVSILSRFATALELQLGQLVELPVEGFPLRRQWHLVHARDRRLGPVDEAFLQFVDDGRWRDTIGHPIGMD